MPDRRHAAVLLNQLPHFIGVIVKQFVQNRTALRFEKRFVNRSHRWQRSRDL